MEDELEKRIAELEKKDSFYYVNEEYGHHIRIRTVGKMATLRFWNWDTTGQLKDNEKYEVTMPFEALEYYQKDYINIQNNIITIKPVKKDSWIEETFCFLIK